jgi:putative N6-adenine-specific DNA methylase
MIARRRAPNLQRRMAVERWPFAGEEARRILSDLRSDATRQERPASQEILGFDKEERAIQAAHRNVREAGLTDTIRLAPGDATNLPELRVDRGLVVSNPPYGDRLHGQGQQAMKNFYYRLGASLSGLVGWKVALLAGNPGFESAFHLRPVRRRQLFNGPIACTLLEYEPGVGSRGKRAAVGGRRQADSSARRHSLQSERARSEASLPKSRRGR